MNLFSVEISKFYQIWESTVNNYELNDISMTIVEEDLYDIE